MDARRASQFQKLSALVLAAFLLLSVSAKAQTDDDAYFKAGAALFKKGNYKKALTYFQLSRKKSPYNADTIYYQAVTSQRLGDTKGATTLYAELVKNYYYCDAGKLAGVALVRLNPTLYGQLRRGAPVPRQAPSFSTAASNSYSNSPYTELSKLPAEARVYFEHASEGLIVDALVNNRAEKMVFDTGADGCVFGMNQLRELGIKPPEGPPTGQGTGVGSSGGIDTWFMNVDLKVGTIERKNFRIAVHQNLPTPPLLGQTFFRDFQYTIDNGGKNIHFLRKSGRPTTVAGDKNSVPFRRLGNDILVDVDVNGHMMTMFFDTGAGSITFTDEQARKAGLTVPEDAQQVMSTGVGGSTMGVTFSVPRMRMGPIEKTNIMVCTVGSAAMPYPLLGTPFFGDWEYTIDNESSVLRFVRR